MVTAKENSKQLKIKPEVKKAIKDFFSTGMQVQEVADKLGIPYHQAYYYSPANKKRKARLGRKPEGKVKRVTAKSVITAKIDELEEQQAKLQLQIDTLKELL